MKTDDDNQIDRLLRSAARAHSAAAIGEPPFGFTTRVVAGWMSARERQGIDVLWFRRAFLCAVAVMAISVGWSFKLDTAAPNDDLAIASYDATTDLP